MTTPTARELEAALLERCTAVARNPDAVATDQREANAFAVAAAILPTRFSRESMNLAQVGERYFALHSGQVGTGEAVCNGWVPGLPRFRDGLERCFDGAQKI